jgi:hypothetical protein
MTSIACIEIGNAQLFRPLARMRISAMALRLCHADIRSILQRLF